MFSKPKKEVETVKVSIDNKRDIFHHVYGLIIFDEEMQNLPMIMML